MKEPVLIIGAGPTGLTLALTLKRHQVPFRMMDQEETPHKQSRALALHSKTMEIFDQLQVSEEILKKALKVRYIDIYLDKKKRAQLDFKVIKTSHPYICILPQNETEHFLLQQLYKQDVKIERAKKLISASQKDDCVEAIFENEEGEKEVVKALWVVGCDGAHSNVRKSIGATFDGKQYQANYTLADVQMKSSLRIDTLNAFGDKRGPLFIFPIGENFYRVVYEKIKGRDKEHTNLHLLEESLYNKALGHHKVFDLEWLSDFKISHRQANIYRKNRLFIAGDAAHIHSPAGGQGLNTGVQDAYNLGWKIAYVYQHKANTKLLSSYSRERISIGKRVLYETDKLTRMMTQKNIVKVKYYAVVLKIMDRISFLKKRKVYQLSGISLRYKKSPITQSQKRWLFFLPAVSAGYPLFDGELMQSKSRETKRVFELTQGKEHTLFIFFKEKKFLKAKALKDAIENRYAHFLKVFLITSSFKIQEDDCWIDKKKENASLYRLGRSFLVMVRPDGYIGMTKKGLKKKNIERYFENLIGIYR